MNVIYLLLTLCVMKPHCIRTIWPHKTVNAATCGSRFAQTNRQLTKIPLFHSLSQNSSGELGDVGDGDIL